MGSAAIASATLLTTSSQPGIFDFVISIRTFFAPARPELPLPFPW